jgi:hypothetical protein
MPSKVYEASPLKRPRRSRRTRAQIEELDEAIIEAVDADAPVTLRGVFYRVVSTGAIDKTERGYEAIGRRLLQLRRDGRVHYADIADGTRWVTKPRSYDSPGEMLRSVAAQYRRALWSRSPTVVQVFSEKEAITGVLLPITNDWDVALGIMRGYASETFAWSVADSLDPFRHTIVVQFGDHDPSGVDAWRNFGDKVTAFVPHKSVEFARLAVTEDQIGWYDLPTRPTKATDSRAAKFVGESVEVDAIPAEELRTILDEFLASFHDGDELERLRAVEDAERQSVYEFARTFPTQHGGDPT